MGRLPQIEEDSQRDGSWDDEELAHREGCLENAIADIDSGRVGGERAVQEEARRGRCVVPLAAHRLPESAWLERERGRGRGGNGHGIGQGGLGKGGLGFGDG